MMIIKTNISKTLITLGALVILAGCSSSRSQKSPDPEILLQKIEAMDYTIEIDGSTSIDGRSVEFGGSYYLKISNGSVDSYLPYVGRARSLPYMGGEGLVFNAALSRYNIQPLKDNLIHVSFESRTQEDSYRFEIYIWSDGTSVVNIRPAAKQYITFNGQIVI